MEYGLCSPLNSMRLSLGGAGDIVIRRELIWLFVVSGCAELVVGGVGSI